MNYSSFGRRFLGTLIDTIILASISLVINRTIPVIGWVISLFLGTLYYPFFWASSSQATPGKYLIGTFVTNREGQRISMRTAFIRYFCSWISGVLLGFGYLLALFTERKQTFHDMMAGTIVVDDDIKSANGLFQDWLDQIKSVIK